MLPGEELAARSLPTYALSMADVQEPSPDERAEWIRDFEAAARRSLEQRMRYAFIRTRKPVLDDASFRAFERMEDYRRWCETSLPSWLGYGRAV
jgi:hypothetical protein